MDVTSRRSSADWGGGGGRSVKQHSDNDQAELNQRSYDFLSLLDVVPMPNNCMCMYISVS